MRIGQKCRRVSRLQTGTLDPIYLGYVRRGWEWWNRSSAIRWFDEIGLPTLPSVGGKGANLGELTAGGLPVPPGFVITGEAYLDAIGARRRP